MEIKILHLIEGAKEARGLTVVIDVFRAFSLECYLTDAGVREIIPVGSSDLARQLKQENPDFILIGERRGVMLPGFDLGNSPAQIGRLELQGKTVVHTTSAGTQGMENAVHADELLTGSLVNAAAIARYIENKQPETVSLVCMGLEAKEIAPEDLLCAEYIRHLLCHMPMNVREEADALRYSSGARFFREDRQEDFPQQDFTLCTAVDRFPFVLRMEQRDGLKHTVRIDV